MPIPEIESLQGKSKDAQVKAAISACIAQEIKNGRSRDQAVAMCYQMARDRTGGSPAAPEQGA